MAQRGGATDGGDGGAKDEGEITERGIREVEEHLASLDAADWGPNARMLERLRAGHRTPQDVHFYRHELAEAALTEQGMPQEQAHRRALEAQGIRYEPGYEKHLYHQDVIREFRTWFNPAAHP